MSNMLHMERRVVKRLKKDNFTLVFNIRKINVIIVINISIFFMNYTILQMESGKTAAKSSMHPVQKYVCCIHNIHND